MRLITATATAVTTAAATAALLVGLPASPASASIIPSGKCATAQQFDKVQNGQTIPQVEKEMGSAGDPNGGVANDSGFRDYDPNWRDCATHGLFIYSVDFHAAHGQQLRVEAKSTL